MVKKTEEKRDNNILRVYLNHFSSIHSCVVSFYVSMFWFRANAIGTDQLCFVHLKCSLQTLKVSVYHLQEQNGVQCFYLSLRLERLILNESLSSRNEPVFLLHM